MKIAITGGAGFIGSYLTNAYLDAGHDVIVIDSLAYGVQQTIDPRARFYQIDIRDAKLRTILQLERPDLVSHHVRQQQSLPGEQALIDADVHVRGLLNVLNSCVNASVKRIIFASGGNSMYTQSAYEQTPLTEEMPVSPRSAYDISKAAGEWYVRYYTQQYGLKHTILRYADVYGEPGRTRFLHPVCYFITMLLEGRRPIIRGTGKEVRDHIFIDDIVRANLKVVSGAEDLTLHISSGQGSSTNQLYRIVAQMVGSEIEPIYLSGSLAEQDAVVLDNTRARQVLGWHPEISLTEGIQQTVKRIRERREEFMTKDAPVPAATREANSLFLTR